MALDPAGTDCPRDPDRLAAVGDRLVVSIDQHQDLADPGEDPGALRRRVAGRQQRHRLVEQPERRLRALVEPVGPAELRADQGAMDRIRDDVLDRDRLAEELRHPMELAGDLGRAGRPLEQLDSVEPERGLRVGDAVPQPEGHLVLALRRRERHGRERGVAGADSRDRRAIVVAGGLPVVGELDPVPRAARPARGRSMVERLGVGAVERAPLAGEHVVVGGLAHEGMTERIAGGLAGSVPDQQLAIDGHAQPVRQVLLREARHFGDELVIDPPAGDRGDPEHPLHVVRGRGDPGDEGRRDRRWQTGRGGIGGLGEQQLLQEEGVAVGSLVKAVEAGPVHRLAVDRLDDPRRIVPIEPREVDAFEPAGPPDLSQPGEERVTAVELVGTVGQAENDALVGEARHEPGDCIARRRVRPVDVLDHEQQRPVRGESAEQPDEGIEQAGAGRGRAERPGVRRGSPGSVIAVGAGDPGKARDQGSQRVERPGVEVEQGLAIVGVEVIAQGGRDGGERQAHPADRDAAALEDPKASLGGPTGELPDEPALAHARLARDEELGRIPLGDAIEDQLGASQLVRPPDEDGADGATGHRRIIRAVRAETRRTGHEDAGRRWSRRAGTGVSGTCGMDQLRSGRGQWMCRAAIATSAVRRWRHAVTLRPGRSGAGARRDRAASAARSARCKAPSSMENSGFMSTLRVPTCLIGLGIDCGRGAADTHREAGLHRSARSVISGGRGVSRGSRRFKPRRRPRRARAGGRSPRPRSGWPRRACPGCSTRGPRRCSR